MSKDLRNLEKSLRTFAKRCKEASYNKGLLFFFLFTGLLSQSASSMSKEDTISGTKKQLTNSIEDMKRLFKEARQENNKLLRVTNLELIQLMEQGDHVVKSPWSSWQFGMNYFYNNWRGVFKGRGDKAEKYPYEGLFKRGEWWERSINPTGPGISTLGAGDREFDPYSASTTRRGNLNNNNYGLLLRDNILEPVVELELGASIRPKTVTRVPVVVTAPAAPSGTGPALPDVSIPRFNPVAPQITVPVPGTAPVFNIELGAFCNNMTGCTSHGNPGYAFVRGGGTVGIPTSFATSITLNSGSIPNDPALRYSWNFSDTVAGRDKGKWRLLKVHFDAVQDAQVDINTPLTIDSINPLTPVERGNEAAAGRVFNNQDFLVGGSRVATLDNGTNNSYIKNSSTLNLKGPLVIGLEMQYDELGDSSDRLLANTGKITDESEASDTLIGGIGKGQSTTLNLGIYGWNTTPPTNLSLAPTEFYRNQAGYFGAKIGLIMTLENDNANAASKNYVFENSSGGTIEFNGDKSIGIQVYSPVKNSRPKVKITNDGTITTNGAQSYGIKVSSAIDNANSSIINKGIINVGGKEERTNGDGLSAGIGILEDSNMDNNQFTAIKAGDMVKNQGKINISGQGNSGMFLKTAFNDTFTNDAAGTIEVTGGKRNIGMRIDTGEVARPGTPENQKGINAGTVKISGGESNIGMFANGATASVTNNNNIEITGGETNAGLMSSGTGASAGFINNGTVTLSGGKNNLGIYIGQGLTGTSTAASKVLITGGEGNTGIANEGGTYSLNGSTIEASGSNAIGIYSNKKGTNLPTTTVTGTIKSEKGAVAMFAENSAMDLTNLNVTVGDTGLLLYNYTNRTNPTGTFKIGANVNANIKKGGVAFYNVGAIGSEKTFLNMLVNNGGVLNLNMEAGGRLFVFDQPGLNVALSSIPSQPAGGTIPLDNANGQHVVSVIGSGYKYYTVNKANLNIDQQVNLNDPADKYHSLDFISSNVTVNSPMTNNGQNIANGLTYAIAQGNTGTSVSDLTVTNNSTIDLTNQSGLTGIVTEFGTIKNVGTLNNTGDNGIGLLGINSSVVENTGTITVGNNGAGLYGINALPSGGTAGDINLSNDGTIKSSGNAAFGVVAKNTPGKSSTVTLGANSNIDFSASPGGVGAYIENTVLNNNGGTITLGENGVGIQGVNSTLNLAGGNIKSTASGVKGIYSNAALTNAGTNMELLGDRSIGLYSPVSVVNNATVKVGNSTVLSSPSIGIYSPVVTNSGTVEAGDKSIGIYSDGATPVSLSSGTVTVGAEGTGVYKNNGSVDLHNGATINTGRNAVGVFGDNATVNNHKDNVSIGDSAIGFAVQGATGVFNGLSSTQSLGKDTIYAYAKDGAKINNSTPLTSVSDAVVGLYGDKATVDNNAGIDFVNGVGNVGILLANGGVGNNNNSIRVGRSDPAASPEPLYSIGMAATGGSKAYNDGTITVTGNRSIGMYATGANSVAENKVGKRIVLDASSANSSSPVRQMTGMFIDNGAKGINKGIIETAGNYAGNPNVSGMIGIVALNGSTFENHGDIKINSDSGFGMYVHNSIIKNYGTIEVTGSGTRGVFYRNAEGVNGNILTEDNVATELNGLNPLTLRMGTVTANGGANAYEAIKYDPTKTSGGITLKKDPIDGIVKAFDQHGNLIPAEFHNQVPQVENFAFSNIGVYIDTLGRTRPITGSGFNPSGKMDLIIGTEIAQTTNAKVIKVGNNIIGPFMSKLAAGVYGQVTPNIYSGSLTWQATYDENDKSVTMAKYDYKKYSKDKNAYNFLDGLEQRYSMNAIDSMEKKLFNKLNGIGDNEEILLTQAFDEMMGHQYANVQQRVFNTGRMLDKEIGHLGREWATSSRQSNKIKAFGMRDEYKTDTAGIIDYTGNAYGFAYLHEDETVKLGNSSGWYAGTVHNRIRFKDIGKSKEDTTMIKAGVFKSTAFDHNGSLKWTISGEGYVSRSDMHRKYLVVDEIFNAKSTYYTYGAAVKNELGKEFRTSERTSIRPYGSLKLEYGRFNGIREKEGEVRLNVKANDYYSIKPEVGVEFKYKQPMAVKTTFVASLGLGYENELGKVGNVGNKARVSYTTADWFNIRGEKDDRKGSFKADLNVGIENQRFGVTFNAGYDTKGKNVRGGIGLRAIF